MAQTGFTPVQLYHSTTAAATPSAGNLAAGELAVNITDGKLFYKDNGGVVRVLATAAGSAGDVVGPGSSTDNALVRFDGTTGKLVQSSVGVLSDAGVLTGLTGLTSSGSITFSGLTSGRVTYAGTGGLLQDSANLTFDGTTLTANALTVSNAVTLSGGTANGVAYLNGSKVLTTGSALTFDGTVLLSGAGGTGTSNSILKLSGSNANNYGSYLQFLRNSVPTWSIGNDSAINGGSSDDLTIYGTASQRFYASGTEQMRLTSTGLGIGTSSPGTKLDVRGNATFTGNGTSRQTADFTNTGGQLYVGAESSSGGAVFVGSSAYAGIVGTNTNTPLQLGTNGTIKATLDSSGNLGLGVTPSAWDGTYYRAFQIANNGASLSAWTASLSSSKILHLTNNGYQTYSGITGPEWRYATDGTSALYKQSSTQHEWYTAPSGTAGNAISFTQAMTLDASGNLLVGTTSSAGTGLTLGNGKDLYLVATGYSSWKQVNYLGGFYLNNGSDRFIVLAGGEVKAPGIYNLTTGAGANVHVASDGTLYRSTSSLKYKTDVQDATHGLAQVMQLRPVTYKGNNDGELVFGGLIAEEVHEAGLTEFVQYAEDGTPDALAYANMVSLAFKAIQEQQAIIEQLKADVAALKGA